MKKLTPLLLVIATAGCVPHWLQLGDRTGPGNKVISNKEDPITLVAVDGSICTVTTTKYHKVKIGDQVWCNWRDRGQG